MKYMKKMDIDDLKTKPEAELLNLLHEYREKLRELRFDLAAGKVKNVNEIHNTKKAIARISTFLNLKKNKSD